MNKQDLIDFETEVAAAFNAGRIRAPVHLSAGNEDQLIELFQRIKPTDWVFSTWRSHYHGLLHGIPREQLMAKVLAGESISINVPERRFYSSAICGGCLPIALGVAWAVKRGMWGQPPKEEGTWKQPNVWCFVGDAAARMGAASEVLAYARNFDLPLTVVVEDNKKCVNASTEALWGGPADFRGAKVEYYEYTPLWPHMGAGRHIEFPDGNKGPQHGGM